MRKMKGGIPFVLKRNADRSRFYRLVLHLQKSISGTAKTFKLLWLCQLDYLYKAVDARDLPCMADVESSMLYFCSLVKQFNSVVLTGECADEIFGGYPWFHKKSSFETNMFPWSPSMQPRQALLEW